MASKTREEYVGKRFLSVKSDGKLKVSKISEWEWRSGVVRAVSTRDSNNVDFTVLVEFDDTGWKNREYLKVHEVFHEFLVEHSLAWVKRDEPNYSPHQGQWPALSYKPVVDKAGLFQQHTKRPVEFLSDRFLSVIDEKDISLYREGDEHRVATAQACSEVNKWVKAWTDYQDGQKILLTTPTVLLGYRVEVYRTEGTTQWYTAVIKSYNHTNKSLTLTDDTVLEEHNEDPTLIQMHLIGDGVVESILNGVDVGVAQRRRPRSTVTKQNSKDNNATSNYRNSGNSSGSGNSCYNSSSSSSSSKISNSLSYAGNNNTIATASGNSSPSTSATLSGNSSSCNTTTTTASTSNNTSSNSTGTTTTASKSSASKSRPLSSVISSSSSSQQSRVNSSPGPPSRGQNTTTACSNRHSSLTTAQPKLLDTTSPTHSVNKGTPSKSPRQTPKRRSDPPPTRAVKKPVTGGRRLKKSASDESVDDEDGDEEDDSTTVCNQTCNVIVERIAQDNKKPPHTRDRTKIKPPRLRDKTPSSTKNSLDLPEEKESESVSDDLNISKKSKGQESSPPPVITSDRETRKSKKSACANITSKSKEPFTLSSSPSKVKENEKVNSLPSNNHSPVKKASVSQSSGISTVTLVDLNVQDGEKSAKQETLSASVVTSISFPPSPCLSLSSSTDPYAKPTAENDSTHSTRVETLDTLVKNRASLSGKANYDIKNNSVAEPTKSKLSSSGKNEVIAISAPKSSNSVIRESADRDSTTKSREEVKKIKNRPPVEECEEGSMHYKKQKILRAGDPSPNNPTPSISEGINVNISLTDQLTKRNKSNFSVNGDGKTGSDTGVIPSDSLLPHNALSYLPGSRDRIDPNSTNLNKVHDFVGERHSAFSSVPRSNSAAARSSEERADSRASDSLIPSHLEDKRPGSRLEDIRSVNSPGSSPLFIDKHEAVHPYRDPILMLNNAVQSNVPNILAAAAAAQQQMNQQNFPVVHQGNPGGPPQSQPGGAFPGVSAIPARALLNSMPIPRTLAYSTGHSLPPSISHHLNLPHGYSLAARAQHQHILLQQQQQQQQQLIAGYPLGSTPMDPVWSKLASNPLTQWPLQKNPESMLAAGEYAALQREQLIHFDHGRREFERREEYRFEKELRDKERKESLERERLEKEKADREKAAIERERERLERERLERDRLEKERLDRDRLEKERLERERQEWEEHKQHQERILRASEVDTVAAVDEHFAASLTKFTNPQGGMMYPLSRGGGGAGVPPGRQFIPKSEPHLPQPPSCMVYHDNKLSMDHHKEDKPKRESDQGVDDKRFVHKVGNDKQATYPLYQYSGYPGSVQATGQKPVFSLYGYPSSPSTISTEQLKQRGLIPDTRPIKEEIIQDKKLPFSSAQIPVSHGLSGYPIKDMKREPHNSVIVARDSKIKMETPIAAHSHHNSPSSSSPRPQHPRPAHTPEQRPDRPHSSSASPASGIHGHLHHHSSVVTTCTPHLPPSHSPAFRVAESHISPRSQSPYKLVASQPQNMPQPLDCCSKPKPSLLQDSLHQRVSSVQPNYPAAQNSVSLANPSLAFSYSLIQQGLVPNPIYSHPSTQPAQQHHNSPVPLNMGRPLPTSLPGPAQHSPPGTKRKPGSKDPHSYAQKKAKNQTDIMPGAGHQPMSIPVTTPQILTNPSPYTTTNSNVFLKSSPGAVTSSTSSPSMSASSFPSAKPASLDNFKSFVENTIQETFQQQNEKALRERALAVEGGSRPELIHPAVKTQENRGVPLPGDANPAAVSLSQGRNEVGPSSLSGGNVSDNYNSRIMDTINRVANNQVDTDSDTLSASSPPPQIKPSDTNSPLNKNSSGASSSGSSHHHMKKAWLQRHDEDKKSETPVFSNPAGEDDSNSSLSHTKDMISCIENPTASINDQGQDSVSASPANVVVTLPNGNISDLNHHNDESTSSASEAETQSPSKVFGSKKRMKQKKTAANGSAKKAKNETESASVKSAPSPSNSSPTPTPTPTPTHTPPPTSNCNSGKKGTTAPTSNSKRKNNKPDQKSKDDAAASNEEEQLLSSSKQSRDTNPLPSRQEKKVSTPVPLLAHVPSPHSPQSERSNPSPALSESNTASSISSSSSSTSSTINTTTTSNNTNSFSNSNSKENKDKKKTRRTKDSSKKSSSFNKPLVKQSVASLKKNMEPFIQDGSCSEITPKLSKCRECKMTPVQRSKKQPNIFCRFYAFRRLRYNQRSIVKIEGFSELSDADPDDIEPWLPRYPVEEPNLDVENSKFIISKVGDKFCELVQQEREAKLLAGEDVKIVWKRAVMGVREMCDVCDTTLFNMHWVCRKCGFVVCLDCYKVRIKEDKKSLLEDKWLTCSSNRQAHDAEEMMLTQIIPSDALWELGRLIHEIRFKWSIPSNCPCGGGNMESCGRSGSKNGINQQLLHAVSNHKLPNGLGSDSNHGKEHQSKAAAAAKKHQDTLDSYNPATTSSPLSILAEVAYMDSESNRDKASDSKHKIDKALDEEITEEGDKKSCSTLRELLTKTARKVKAPNDKKTKKGSGTNTLVDIIHSVVEKSCMDGGAPFKFMHYTPRLGGWKRELPIMVHNLTETSVLYPDVPHSWLCDGRLLRLHDAHHKGNLQIFQEQWKRGQPVLVSCANKAMNISLWKPEVFSKEFGHIKNEVVNCRTGDAIIGHTMSEFWEGFECLEKRPLDENDEPLLLKLKDWPPGDDFSELLPSRFQDLMQALPLPEYSQRNGKLNLASRLPDFLVRPDLGPKMYNAYGSSEFPTEGTTNLHLDISDAVNIMVYVGIPRDGPGGRKAHEDAAVKAIDDVGCDSITKRRVREVHEIPGALWHIYDAHDADKIRDFLNKVAKERGEIIQTDHDAIHDQSWYLNKDLCDRLYKEYGVQGYTIVQCHGDAIFIPAGAPHQVRNLHSCVKVAEDFVSPEHLNHCFRLTQEFRQLSETHSNHEDKLQVKNIIYHAVKDSIAVLREHDPKDE